MKDSLKDANFPRTPDLRVYHLGLRPGEVANRIVTVGSPSRARTIAQLLDVVPKPFVLESERGFLTFTGRYKGIPVSIMSIGMGSPNMDFFVRETRECLSGDMLIIRLGSCGCLIDAPVGTVVVPKACVAVTRNMDFDFINPDRCEEPPYRISKPVYGDSEFHTQVKKSLETAKPIHSGTVILADTVNASADSFYSSQGRQTSFPDNNDSVIDQLLAIPDMATLEMETHHLYHLAACWGKRKEARRAPDAPLTTRPVVPKPVQSSPGIQSDVSLDPAYPLAGPDTVIKVSAAQMVFANRSSRDFISPEQVSELERWTGQGVLDALAETSISLDQQHPEKGSVWEII
ncbi:purine and uridine phosphorylase [Marasmius fiardii PR-910]|nr:purine and uridine phosphorylase [Marasmius fiardii PR-910]